jgi:serine/threonine protein kinase
MKITPERWTGDGGERVDPYAFGKNFIHRDYKPNNIFLTYNSSGEFEGKLGDFGLIRLAVQSTGKSFSVHQRLHLRLRNLAKEPMGVCVRCRTEWIAQNMQ